MRAKRVNGGYFPAICGLFSLLSLPNKVLFKQTRLLDTRRQGPDSRVVNNPVEVKKSDSGGRNLNPTVGWYFRTHKEKFYD